LAAVVEQLLADDTAVEIAGRTIRLADPVTGDAGAAALRVLGRVQAAAPVGAAAHAATGVAAAVWLPPHLYLARWAKNRWVVGYRLTGGWTPNDYIRSDGRIPKPAGDGQLVSHRPRRGAGGVRRGRPVSGIASFPPPGAARGRAGPEPPPPEAAHPVLHGGGVAAEAHPGAQAAGGAQAGAGTHDPRLSGLQHAQDAHPVHGGLRPLRRLPVTPHRPGA
jgi:hypothetical protein